MHLTALTQISFTQSRINLYLMPEFILIKGGDFNCAMNDIDRTKSFTDSRLSLALMNFVADLQLIAIW